MTGNNARYEGYSQYRKSQVSPEAWDSEYERHRQERPTLYWGVGNSPKDLEHMYFLIRHRAWPYLDRASDGKISLRDAVGALKRKFRKEMERISNEN